MRQSWTGRATRELPHAIVVDDDTATLAFVSSFLQKLGYCPLAATSAETALDLLDRHGEVVSLLVCDVQLPGMSGATFATLARMRSPHLAVVLMSGAGRNYLAQRGLITPRAPLLVKPFLSSELFDMVNRAHRDLAAVKRAASDDC